jgi:hypothetical protein
MHFCFVSTSRGSYFMTELLDALAVAAEASGHAAERAFDEFPTLGADSVYVAIPHEFGAWGSKAPDSQQRARTIALCTENPGTEWFESTYRLVAEFGAAVSINRSSAAELRRRGVPCEHLQLGYSARWDRWDGGESLPRPIDVLYLGAADPRRDPLLAGIGTSLWSRNCQFLVPPLEPRTAPRADFLKEDDKYHRLAASKILLNLHRKTSAAFEWMRFLEAISNGCVVVSEPSLDSEPLVAGEHFIAAPVARIADTVDALLENPDRLRALRTQAYEFVRTELPIDPAGKRLAEIASELPRRESLDPVANWAATDATSSSARDRTPRLDVSRALEPARGTLASDVRAVSSGVAGRRAAHRFVGIGRRVGRLRRRARGVIVETPSYASARPRVSVLAVLGADYERRRVELLDGVASSRGEEFEIVVLADRSSGDAWGLVIRFLANHPDVPACMLDGEPSALGAARNQLAERSRGELLLVLPGEGGIFPTTARRLAGALNSDPASAFSYPMVAVVDEGAPVELRGSMPWEPARLARQSWIDAPAMVRRERLLELGGYATDRRLDGLEDFDLWCRLADSGEHGAHVPQVLGWHPSRARDGPGDLAALTPATKELIRARSPCLFAGQAAA